MADDGGGDERTPSAIHLTIPREYYLLPGFMATTGATIGLFRGSRTESLRYLAENAHRAPTTLRGWYYYNKTKNYRVMLGGLRGGGADGLRLGLAGAGWVAVETGLRRAGLDDVREVGAGLGMAAMFAAVYRLPWIATRRAMVLGLLTGTTMRMLRYGQAQMGARLEAAGAGAGSGAGSEVEADDS